MATKTTFPSTWTTQPDGSVMAPDGNSAHGDVLNLFTTTFATVDDLTDKLAAATGGGTTTPGTGPTQAAFDALKAEVDALRPELDRHEKIFDLVAADISANETPAPTA